MSYGISQEPDATLGFSPEHHHVSAVDSPGNGAGDPAHAKEEAREVHEADSSQSAQAHKGAAWALQGGTLKGDSMPFNESVGLHSIGADHLDCFSRAVRDSGGVRQGSSWTSDPAPGVQRVLCDHTLTLEKLSKPGEKHDTDLKAGAGDTFEKQRKSHWSHDRWGG